MLSTAPDELPANFEIYSYLGFIYGDYYEKNRFGYINCIINDWGVRMYAEQNRGEQQGEYSEQYDSLFEWKIP